MDLMQDEKCRAYLEMKGLSLNDAEMFFAMLESTSDDGEVDIDIFVAGCMKMKGLALNIDLLACQSDIKLMTKAMKRLQHQTSEALHAFGTILPRFRESREQECRTLHASKLSL